MVDDKNETEATFDFVGGNKLVNKLLSDYKDGNIDFFNILCYNMP